MPANQKKTSQLDALTSPVPTDTFIVYDVSAGKTVQVTGANARKALGLEGANIAAAMLEEMVLARAFEISSVTRTDGLVSSATGTFRDGSALTYAATRSNGLLATEAYAHADSGLTTTITYTRTAGLITSYTVVTA